MAIPLSLTIYLSIYIYIYIYRERERECERGLQKTHALTFTFRWWYFPCNPVIIYTVFAGDLVQVLDKAYPFTTSAQAEMLNSITFSLFRPLAIFFFFFFFVITYVLMPPKYLLIMQLSSNLQAEKEPYNVIWDKITE